MMRIFPALALALMAVIGSPAIAQHATAFDIEDGGRVYQSSCAPCHGPDGNLIAGIDFSSGIYRRPLTDEDLIQIILNGLPETPMPPMPGMSDEQAMRVVSYLRSLPAAPTESASDGDAVRGREIVVGRGQCLDCHRIAKLGSRAGPDLSSIGLERRAVELERSLVDPDSEVRPANRSYTVVPQRGPPVTGRLLNHDTFTVQLIDASERLRSFQKSELRDFGFAASPMPSYRQTLDAQALADVVSYLVTLRGESSQ